jgi:cytochrome c biogenesis protein CcdA
VSGYYEAMSAMSNWIGQPLNQASAHLNVAILTALLLGIIGSLSPCQLSTNLSAVAYISRRIASPWGMWRAAWTYFAGKALVYTAIAGVFIGLGLTLADMPSAVAVAFRRALGPLLILLGVLFLGLVRPKLVVGLGASRWLQSAIGERKGWGSLLLGVAFAFAFCPTLFLLFFGFLVPMSGGSRVGFSFPGLFALGTTLPLHLLVAVAAVSAPSLRRYTSGVRGLDNWLRRIAGVVFIVAGANEVLLYWVLA